MKILTNKYKYYESIQYTIDNIEEVAKFTSSDYLCICENHFLVKLSRYIYFNNWIIKINNNEFIIITNEQKEKLFNNEN